MVNSDHIGCDCGRFDCTCWAIQLHDRVANVQDTDQFVDQPLGCHSGGVSVNDASRNLTIFAASRLCVFLSSLQHSVPGIFENVSYCLRLQNTISNHGCAVRLKNYTCLPNRLEFHFREWRRNGSI